MSFIQNVNKLVGSIDAIDNLNVVLDVEKVTSLLRLSLIDITALSEDLAKGTYLGNKQLVINLLHNYKDYSSTMTESALWELYNNSSNLVRYSTIQVTLDDLSVLTFNVAITTNEELLLKLQEVLVPANGVMSTKVLLVPATVPDYQVLITDIDGGLSNVTKVTLVAHPDDNYKQSSVGFAWADFTSALQLCVQYIEDITQLAANLNTFVDAPATLGAIVTEANDILANIINIQTMVVQDRLSIEAIVVELETRLVEVEAFITTVEATILEMTQLTVRAEAAAASAEEDSLAVEANTTTASNAAVSALASSVTASTMKDDVTVMYNRLLTLEATVDTDAQAVVAAKDIVIATSDTVAENAQIASNNATVASNKAVEASNFASSAESSAISANTAKSEAVLAKDGAEVSAANAKISEDNAKVSETNAKESEDKTKQYRDETEAMTSAGISPATINKLGGVKVGSGVSVTSDGTISVVEYGSATNTVEGIVTLSDATDSASAASSGVAASPLAVRLAFEKGQQGVNSANAVQSNLEVYSTATDARISALVNDKATLVEVQTLVAALVDSSPEALDTLNELAAALGDDPNFAATVSTQIGSVNTKAVNAQTTADSASTVAASANTLAQEAKEAVEGAVLKTGSVMTGQLAVPSLNLDNVVISIVQDGDRKKMTFTF